MKNSLTAYVGWLLLISAFGFYSFGICKAIALCFGETPIRQGAYPETLATTMSSLQALLLTNLGAVLGISVVKPKSGVARNIMLNASLRNEKAPVASPLMLREKLQLVGVVLFLLGLIACLVVWILKEFVTDDKVVIALIPESGKMFLGVVLAYVTVVLSTAPEQGQE